MVNPDYDREGRLPQAIHRRPNLMKEIHYSVHSTTVGSVTSDRSLNTELNPTIVFTFLVFASKILCCYILKLFT